MTLRHPLYCTQKGGITLDQRFYQTSQFAQKASVSIRTLRYYDKVGLLSPSQYTQAGYRLYTDRDLLYLQQILALKFLGFSLDEIKICLQTEPQQFQHVLVRQRAMLYEKRLQLEKIIQAIDRAENELHSDQSNWESIVSVIQVMQMQQNNDWRNKYFSNEQLQKMEELSKKSYTEEQRQKLTAWGKGWSEEDQKQADQQWGAVNTELHRLVAEQKDPASAEAQAWAKVYDGLIGQFTRGDAGIESGLKNLYQNLNQLPTDERPMQLPYSAEEGAFIQKVMAIYKQK